MEYKELCQTTLIGTVYQENQFKYGEKELTSGDCCQIGNCSNLVSKSKSAVLYNPQVTRVAEIALEDKGRFN